MSEFQVRVVRIGDIEKHPNADSLSITHVGGVGGYPCIIRTGDLRPGDLAVYVPVGALLPADDARWDFLRRAPGEPVEIEAKRLRGIFSMGVLARADDGLAEGQDMAEMLRITRAEPPEPTDGNEPDPGLLPTFTDIPALRGNPGLLRDGEEVVITEKIHGETGMFAYANGRLYCGSRTAWKSPDGGPVGGVPGAPLREHAWWNVARRLDLEGRLRNVEGIGIYGEVFGDVAGMKYGRTSDSRDLRLFAAMDIKRRAYMDYDDFAFLARALDLPVAPVLYRGPWSDDLRGLAEGNSTLAAHVREGFVVCPVRERFDDRIGRVILKLHGQGYLLRKKK